MTAWVFSYNLTTKDGKFREVSDYEELKNEVGKVYYETIAEDGEFIISVYHDKRFNFTTAAEAFYKRIANNS